MCGLPKVPDVALRFRLDCLHLAFAPSIPGTAVTPDVHTKGGRVLLNRTPLYAGPETVVSPDLVERAYSAFQDFDWTNPELLDLQNLIPSGRARRRRS